MTDDMAIIERVELLGAMAHDLRRDLKEIQEDDAPTCGHCGSPFTWYRTDGDVACHDCPGITTTGDADA